MEENKDSFKEKWKDKKYQAKVKLSSYGIFIVFIIVILLLGHGNNDTIVDNNSDFNNETEGSNQNNIIFNKPDSNNYEYEIEIIYEKNNIKGEIIYYGKVLDKNVELTKKYKEETYYYKIFDNKYYKLDNNNYVLSTKEELYDVVDYNYYLNIDSINNYLSFSKYNDGVYQVYIKDIVLESNTDEYIEIRLENDNISVDYTSLVNILDDENYDNFVVNISYNESDE